MRYHYPSNKFFTPNRKLALLLLILLTIGLYAQAQPTNDNCANALFLSANQSCVNQTFSTIASTSEDTEMAPNPSCGAYAGNDVWFTTQVPETGNLRVEMTAANGINISWALYTGVCGEMEQIGCFTNSANRDFILPERAGETLYLRAWNTSSSNQGEFNLCIWEQPVPENNFCSNAIELEVTESMQAYIPYSNRYSTTESNLVVGSPTCGIFQGGDVWFKALMPASGALRVDFEQGIMDYEIYRGSCSNFTTLYCSGRSSSRTLYEPELAGEYVYIRVWAYNNSGGTDFGIRTWEPEIIPNNYCADATFIEPSDFCAPQTFTNRYATSESVLVAPNPSCGFYRGGDAWFKTIVPESGKLRFDFTNLADMNNFNYVLYSGSCGQLTQMECFQLRSENNFHEPEMAGEEIYIRVFRYDNRNGGEFTFCLWEPETPDNDLCHQAVELEVKAECMMENFTGRYTTGTPTSIAPTPSCGLYLSGDAWFKILTPSNGSLQIEAQNLADMNAMLTLYRGECGSMAEIACSSNRLITLNEPDLANQYVYLRVFRQYNRNAGDFALCVRQPSCVEADVDEAAPLVYTQNVSLSLDINGLAHLSPDMVDDGSFDDCSLTEELTFELSQSTFDCTHIGENEVTLTVTDPSGNSSQATALVSITDDSAPILITNSITRNLDENGQLQINLEELNDGSFDNCTSEENLIWSLSKSTFDCSNLGTNVVQLSAEDENGNVATANVIVTIRDNLPPVPDEEVLDELVSYCSLSIADIPTASDNCGGTLSATTNDPLFYNVPGEYTINWRYNDGSNAVVSQSQQVRILQMDNSVQTDGLLLSVNMQEEGMSYQWFSCDTDLPLADENKAELRPNNSGNFYVAIYYKSCVSYSDCISITVNNAEQARQQEWVVYPNPSFDWIKVEQSNADFNFANYRIISVGGQIQQEGIIERHENSIDISALEPGIYFVQLNEGEQIIKFLKR